MLFINTRPVERANALNEGLRLMGLADTEILSLPLLALTPVTLSEQQQVSIQRLLSAYYDVLVVVSPTAGRLGCQYLNKAIATYPQPNSSLSSCKQSVQAEVVSVGKATAKVLKQQGISTTIPNINSNEGMLALECMQKLSHRHKVMVWRGQGGRELLIDTLRQRGVQVDVIELYQRQLPPQTTDLYQQYLPKLISLKEVKTASSRSLIANVLISSGDSFQHWQTLVKQAQQHSLHTPTPHVPTLADFHYLVLGQRLAKLIEQHQFSYQMLENLNAISVRQAFNE